MKLGIENLLIESPCIFARSVIPQSGPSWERKKSLDANLQKQSEAVNRWTNDPSSDIFIIAAPASLGRTISSIAVFLNLVLRYLHKNSSNRYDCFDMDIETESWRYCVSNRDLFVLCLAPIYPSNHSRCSFKSRGIYVVLQKYSSFDKFVPKGQLVISEDTRKQIRWIFQKKGMGYDLSISLSPIDAYKFLKPINNSDSIIKWWTYK